MQHPTTLPTTGHPANPGTSDPTVFVMVDNQKKQTSFPKKLSIGLSLVQIILGIVSFFAQTVIIILLSTNGSNYKDYAGGIGEGIYCGIFFIIAGGLGILASRKPSTCNISAFMTLSIIASIISGIQIILASLKLTINDDYYGRVDTSDREPKMVMLSIIVLAGALEMIVGIVCAAICCGACCCQGNGSSDGRVVYLAQGEHGSGPVPVQLANSFPVQMANGVPVQIANGVTVQMPYLPQANPVTGVLNKQLNEVPYYRDVVSGYEQETKEKYGKGGYMRVEN